MDLSAEEIQEARQSLPYAFPELGRSPFKITSPATREYNCIAWAAGDPQKWWWPFGAYWPNGIEQECTIEAFCKAFGEQGYIACESADLEKGYEKIALYIDAYREVTHAARQLQDGQWTSKLGKAWDITHTLEGLHGNAYGRVGQILKRKV